jgi:hypothetical protein
MPEPLTEEVKEQFNIIFSGKFVKVKRGEHTEGTKLYLTITDVNWNKEISHTYTNPENYEFENVLDIILQLRNILYIPGLLDNDKLAEEARKEILKLIGLLVWKII